MLLTVTSNDIKYLMVTLDRCPIFPSVELVRNVKTKQGQKLFIIFHLQPQPPAQSAPPNADAIRQKIWTFLFP
uniref:Uncharacterized protein n=1 Tax=Glossina brevipalpis TaxID=37001 RepID=A0A1A9W8R1_9MUSC